MGITAENVAAKFNVSRAEQDAFALASHQKAAAARAAGKFEQEIVPVTGVRYKGNERVTFEYKTDELIRADTSAEGLAGLKPAFALKGSVTPGNSSPLSDGAAAALLMTEEKAATPLPSSHRYSGQPHAWIIASAVGHTIEHGSQIRQFITGAGNAPDSSGGQRRPSSSSVE